MSSAAQAGFGNDSWQTPRNARTLRAYMALRNQEIGQRVRELRGNRPQTVVADALGVSERALQNWEAGEAKPAYRNLQRLADYYGTTEEYILTGARPEEPPRIVHADGREARFAELGADTPDIFGAHAADRALAQALEGFTAAIEKQNELLARQSKILERIEAAIDREDDVRDEISEMISRRGRAIVEGHPQAADSDPRPVPPRSGDARKSRAKAQRTPGRP